MRLSLLEVNGGIVLGGAVALGVFVPLSTKATFRNLVFALLPLTYISAIVLWLVVFALWFNWVGVSQPGFLYFWHKVIAVGCLTFFPLVQALWGFREGPVLYRILLAIDDALPIGFIAMVFGEAWAATQRLGIRCYSCKRYRTQCRGSCRIISHVCSYGGPVIYSEMDCENALFLGGKNAADP